MKIKILKAVPASGKTKAILEHINESKGKSIVASISRSLSKQSYDYFKNLGGKGIILDSDHCSQAVTKEIVQSIKHNDVIFITHSALFQLENFSLFSEYDLYIDEVPEFVTLESYNFTHTSNFILDYCDEIGDEINKQYSLRLKDDQRELVVSMAKDGQKELDSISKSIFPLLLALIQELPVNVVRTETGIRCYFVNDITSYNWKEFKSITIACANFENTMTGTVLKYFSNWEFQESELKSRLLFTDYRNTDRILIHVYHHKDWSRYLGDKSTKDSNVYDETKKRMIDDVGDEKFIYTRNTYRNKIFKGNEVPYNPHGLNMYKSNTNVMALFCYNPLPWQIPLLKELCVSRNIDENILIDAFVTSKYLEPIFQLCLRSDIRNQDSKKRVNLYVPDYRCVNYLKENYLSDAEVIENIVKCEVERKARKRPGMPGLFSMETKVFNAYKRWIKKHGYELSEENPTDILKVTEWLKTRK